MKFAHRMKPTLLLMAAGLVLLAGRVEAQFPLSSTLWEENISLTVGPSTAGFQGSDSAIPESHTEELSGIGYAVAGSVGFGSAGPPEGTAEVTWNISEGNTSLNLSSIVSIDFQFRVVETATPPVSVTDVPVHLLATGGGAVRNVFGSRATSSFRFQAVGAGILITSSLDVNGDSGTSDPATDAFTIDQTPAIPVDTVTLVGMSASASMLNVSVGAVATGTATGTIDPVIEIADELIPGTSSSYRDFFAIEFSDGYDAQTPVERITFGELKRRFGQSR